MQSPLYSALDNREPAFIGGFRSGTTLLINLLGLHPEVAPWFETKGLCEALRWMRVMRAPEFTNLEAALIRPADVPGFNADAVAKRILRDIRETMARMEGMIPSGKAVGERYPIGYDVTLYDLEEAEADVKNWLSSIATQADLGAVTRATGDLIRNLGGRQLIRAGKPRWVNKTPEITRFTPELWDCLGPCRTIMMIRDGRRVVCSATKLGWAQASEIGVWWKAMIEESREGGSIDPRRYLEVKYEALIEQPEFELDRVTEFLGVKPCGASLVQKYLAALDVPVLKQASLSSLGESEEKDINGLIDEEFNRALGY